MSDNWKQFDLEGEGLQTVNLLMTREQRKRATAYAWWLLFPLGAHRIYLKSSTTSLVYTALTAIGFILLLAGTKAAMWIWAVEIPLALFDLYWIDRRVTRLNKELRMALYMQKSAAPPPGYQGRYVDAETLLNEYSKLKDKEKVSDKRVSTQAEAESGKRIPSFKEQEALLKELAKHKRSTRKSD